MRVKPPEHCVKQEAYLGGFLLEASQKLVERQVPPLERLSKVPGHGHSTAGTAYFARRGRMQGGDESGEERLEQLDEDSLERSHEIVDVGQLENALVCDLFVGVRPK
jgi:hypothetical protein